MANSKSKRTRKVLIFSAIAVVVIAGACFAIFRERQLPIKVQTEKVARRNITELVVANGKIQPVLQVVINPEVSGEIIELPVKEGQPVKKGDLLLKIKPDNYRASRNSAEPNYQSIVAGTVTKLKSQIGERVVGTALMAGTEIMTVADLREMEARVDIGEVDIVLIALGQTARLEVDAFRDRKFAGKVTEIANASKMST